MLIVAAFLCTSICVVAEAKTGEGSTSGISKEIRDTGTIFRSESSKTDIFLIKGDNGVDLMGMHFDTYLPLNLDPEYKQDGLRVEFTAQLPIMLSIRHFLICMNNRALPIRIIDIKELEEPEYGVIMGHVCEACGQTEIARPVPIPGAKVIARLIKPTDVKLDDIESNEFVYKTYTDKNGLYALKDVKAGNYVVKVSHEGYKSDSKETEVKPELTAKVDFLLEKNSEELVELTLDTDPWGLAFNVFSLNPKPIPYHGATPTDGRIHVKYVKGTEVRISVEEEYNGLKFVRWSGDASGEDNPLEVTMDSDKSIVAVFTETTKIGIIYGTVSEDNSLTPIVGANVVAHPENSITPVNHYQTKTDERGDYRLEVPAGTYVVVASKEGYLPQKVKVEVNPGDELEVNFQLKQMPTVDSVSL